MFAAVMLYLFIQNISVSAAHIIQKTYSSLSSQLSASLLRASVVPTALVFFVRDKHLLQGEPAALFIQNTKQTSERAHCCLTGCSMDYQRQLPASALTYSTLWSGHAFHSFVISEVLFEGINSFLG